MPNNSYLVYGGDLMLFAHTGATVQPLAFSTSAKLSVSMKTREISSKDSVGDFTEYSTGKFDWNVSSDALVNFVSTGTTNSVDELYTFMINKELLNIAFGSKTGTSPSWTVSSSVKKFTGTAYITSIDINAGDNDNATYSITMQGSGALALA